MATYTALSNDESDEPPRQHRALTTQQSAATLLTPSKDPQAHQTRYLSPSPAPSRRPLSPRPSFTTPLDEATPQQPPKSSWQRFWATNKGSALVAISQFFGAQMNLSARLLERESSDKAIHPVQLLLLRQSVTALFCFIYMWFKRPPGGIFGDKSLRVLLTIRGVAGFFGIMGMWTSMLYLPLADATVITFLAPGIAGIICYVVLREPFTKMEQLATLVALLGVVFIAQPASLFSEGNENEASAEPRENAGGNLPGKDHEATAEERLVAVGLGLLGVLGAAGAFTTLRCIGKRAHPLISVNWFALTCTAICVIILAVAPILNIMQPSLRFSLPSDLKSWLLLLSLGALGFVMQYLLTAGLAADKSNRANSMVYTHMLFAVAFDKWVFDHDMGFMSFMGCALILGSAVGVVLMKKPAPQKAGGNPANVDLEGLRNGRGEGEASPMLVGVGGNTVDELSLDDSRR